VSLELFSWIFCSFIESFIVHCCHTVGSLEFFFIFFNSFDLLRTVELTKIRFLYFSVDVGVILGFFLGLFVFDLYLLFIYN